MKALAAAILAPLHHGEEGIGGEFDYVDGIAVAVILLVLAAIGFGVWKLVQRRRYG